MSMRRLLLSHMSMRKSLLSHMSMRKSLLGNFNRVKISAINDDPLYDDNSFQYDFSILTLAEPVTFSASLAPACMPW